MTDAIDVRGVDDHLGTGRGKLIEAQIAARSRMYVSSAREAFQRGKARANPEAADVRWTLGTTEHCPDCLAFAGMGWQRIEDDPYGGAVPGSGATQCLVNCGCDRDFR